MALVFLFISFFFALWGAWEFFSVFFGEANPSQITVAAMTGMALSLIPYLIGKSLAEMIAIRQRHMLIEQSTLQQRLMIEAMDDAAIEMEKAEKAAAAKVQTPMPPPASDLPRTDGQ